MVRGAGNRIVVNKQTMIEIAQLWIDKNVLSPNEPIVYMVTMAPNELIIWLTEPKTGKKK